MLFALYVIPVKTGIHLLSVSYWMPSFAGMTDANYSESIETLFQQAPRLCKAISHIQNTLQLHSRRDRN